MLDDDDEEPDPTPFDEASVKPERTRRLERTPELPPRPFLYTLDQISALLYIDVKYLKLRYIYFHDRTVGPHYPDYIAARNIAPPGRPPDWRVPEHELARWLKRKGYRLHQRGWVT